MKFNLDVSMDDDKVENALIDLLAEKILENWYDDNFIGKIEDSVMERINDAVDNMCFKSMLAQNIIEKISSKYELSEDYKRVMKDLDIKTEKDIGNGLKDIVAKIVRAEIKRMIAK